MVEEFDAVGIDFEERNRRTEECIQIYKASWTGDLATFEGNYYSFRNVSQDPKPAQQSPHPPIVFGGNTIRGARRAARFCEGLYPLFLDTYTEAGRYAPLQDEVRRELEARGKQPVRLPDAVRRELRASPMPTTRPRRRTPAAPAPALPSRSWATCRISRDAGYSMVVCMLECPSGAHSPSSSTRSSASAPR